MNRRLRNMCKMAFILTALLGSISVSMGLNTNQAKADSKAPSKIDSKTQFPNGTHQGLLLSPDTEDTPVSVKVTGDTSQKVNLSDIKPGKGTYASFNQKYGSQLASLAYDINLSGITFTAQYGVVGKTTSGDPVTAKVEISKLTKATAWDHATINTTQYAPRIEFSDSLYNGFDTKGIQSMNFKITFTDEKTNKDIAFNKDAYISWNSLNPNATNQYGHGHAIEAVAYLNNDGNNDSYITKDSVIEQYKSPLDSSLTLTGGAITPNQSYDTIVAEDSIGAAGFAKHSVSYPLTGTTQEFSINSLNPSLFGAAPDLSKSNGQDYWFSPSTATVFTPTPDKPTKQVVDPTTKADMNGKQVKDGQALQYQVSQKVSYLGQDTLERYNSMTWSDKLPAGFVYKNAYLADADGNKVKQPTTDDSSKGGSSSSNSSSTSTSSSESSSTSSTSSSTSSSASSDTKTSTATDTAKDGASADWSGTATFDKATNTVTYKASPEFLASMKMSGETYKLIIDGTVDTNGAATTLENQANVKIDGKSTDTNKVTNSTTPPAKGTLEKTVTVDGKTGASGVVIPGKDYAYQLKAQIENKSKINSLEISDPLEKVQTYESATVTDEAGKDITDQGTLSFDKATNTVKWAAKSPSEFSGKKINMNIKVKLNADADLSSYKVNGKVAIPNVGQLKTDDGTTPSNATSVTVPSVAPSAHKAIQLNGEEPNGTETGNGSDTATSNSNDSANATSDSNRAANSSSAATSESNSSASDQSSNSSTDTSSSSASSEESSSNESSNNESSSNESSSNESSSTNSSSTSESDSSN